MSSSSSAKPFRTFFVLLPLGPRDTGWWELAVRQTQGPVEQLHVQCATVGMGVPGRGAETREGAQWKWTWSSTGGEGIEAEVRVWTHFSEKKAIGWSGKVGDMSQEMAPREEGRARLLWASSMAGRMDMGGSEGGDSIHVAGAGWSFRARPAPG